MSDDQGSDGILQSTIVDLTLRSIYISGWPSSFWFPLV